MIVLSFLLVVVAAVTLVIGLFQDTLAWIWTSIACCVVAMVFLGIGVLQRRRAPATESGYGPGSQASSQAGAGAALVRAAEKVTPSRSRDEEAERPAREERDEEISVIPRTTLTEARSTIEDTEVEPTIVPKRTAPRRSTAPVEREESATEDAAAAAARDPEVVEPVRPIKRAATRRTAAKRAETAKKAEPAKKATTKRTAKRATPKKTTAKAASTGSGGTTGAKAKRELAKVKGVGPAKQQALLDEFGSLESIRDASVDDLQKVSGIGPALAEEISRTLKG